MRDPVEGGRGDQLLGVGVAGVVEQGGDGPAPRQGLGRLGAEDPLGQGRLGIQVGQQDAAAVPGEGAGQVVARRGLAAAPLAVRAARP